MTLKLTSCDMFGMLLNSGCQLRVDSLVVRG